MIKRQFGKGKAIKASEQNLAQVYTTTNIKDIAVDGNIIGITSSGYLYPDTINLDTVILISLQSRNITGERIYIDTSTGIYMKPSIYIPSGYELYMSAFAAYLDDSSEIDVDSNGVTYYKDIQNGYSIYTLQGILSTTGSAVKPTIPESSILLCDILYDNSLYLSGLITSSGIDISRQTRRIHVHSNKDQLDLITDGNHENRTDNPHSVTKTQVGLGNVTNDTQVKATLGGVTDGSVPVWAVTTGDGLSNGYTVGSTLIDSTTEIPNSLAIQNYIADLPDVFNVLQYKGEIDCSSNPNYPSSSTGYIYKISVDGKIGGASGRSVNEGDFILCKVDGSSAGDEASVGTNWIILNKAEFVIGPTSATDNDIVLLDASGKILFDSGYPAQDATTSQIGFVQLSDLYNGTSSGLAATEKALSDGLAQWSNVTNDAQLIRAGNDYSNFDAKTTSTGFGDIVLIEDSEDSYTKKQTYWGNLLSSSGSFDADAFYLTSAGEIDALTEKTSLNSSDVFFIEDSEESFSKKKVSSSSLSSILSQQVSIYESSTGDVGELEIISTSSGYTTVSINTIIGDFISNPQNYNTWSTTGNLNTARYYLAGCGTQNSSLSFGGFTGSIEAVTEKFNGYSWSNTGTLATGVYAPAGCGIQNSALCFGGNSGSNTDITQEFDGSTWSTDAGWNLNTARSGLSGTGIQSSALSFGGNGPSAVTEKFNGTSWSTSGNLNTARQYVAGAGVQSATLSFGGLIVTYSAVTEKFNGSTWTASGNLNTARESLAGAGTQNAALSIGGQGAGTTVVTEKFNGSTWATSSSFNLNTGRTGLSGSGLQNSALSFGGSDGSYTVVTEKFNEPYKLRLDITALENTIDNTATQRIDISTYESNCVFNVKIPSIISYGIVCEREYDTYANKAIGFNAGSNILNYGYWSNTGIVNVSRRNASGCGLEKSALLFGGATQTTEKFNGSTWTTDAGWDISATAAGLGGCGAQNSALRFGGVILATTEKFNGSVWSATGSLNTARYGLASSGVQNAALSIGGYVGSVSQVVEKFNGSIWSTSTSLPAGNQSLSGSGVQNATIVSGGYTTTYTTESQKFNGYTWSFTGSITTARYYLGSSGNQNSSINFGGANATTVFSVSEKFNGNSWIVSNSLLTGRSELSTAGTSYASLSISGHPTGLSQTDITEKFNYNADISELFSDELDVYIDKSNVKIYY